MQVTVNQNSSARGCLVLFSLPFIAMGLFFAYASYQNLNNPDFKNPHIGIVVGLIFACFGLLIAGTGVQGTRALRKQQAVQAAYPDQPWLWRADWAEGRAKGSQSNSAASLWIFALLWNAISWTVVYGMLQKPLTGSRWVYLLLALFPLIGIGLVIGAVVQTLRRLRFGKTFLQLQTLPAPLGAKLRGTIDVHLPYPLPHGIYLAFTCVNRVTTGSGKNRSTFEHIRWQEKINLGSERMMAGPTGTTIPIEFDVPRNMRASDSSNPADQILWYVRAQADIPGVDFDEKYEVPVFETRESPSLEDWQSRQDEEQRTHPPSAPVNGTVKVSPALEGGTQFYFPAGRNVSAAMGITLFALIFTGAEVAIIVLHAPLIFAIVFGLAVLILWYGSLNTWFGTARIVVNRDAVQVYNNLLGIRSGKRWLTAEIKSVYPKITMQSGDIPYYSVTVQTLDGREYQMGNSLRDHDEAEWICAQIRQIANLNARTVATSN